jgi:hypothetical protein
VPVLTQIREDARLLALLLEALESTLEVFVVVDDDFRQKLFPDLVAVRPLSLQSAITYGIP